MTAKRQAFIVIALVLCAVPHCPAAGAAESALARMRDRVCAGYQPCFCPGADPEEFRPALLS